MGDSPIQWRKRDQERGINMQNTLHVEHLEKYYGSRSSLTKAIDDLSFDVQPQEFVAIMGASGSGKTTLLNCISTVDRPTAGNIYVDGENVTKLRGEALNRFRRERFGFIFQDFNLLDTLTAYENIALALSIQNVKAAEIDKRVRKVAKELDIANVLNKYPYEMSGGQRQRVAIARALANEPPLILADEPTGNLDTAASIEIMEIFSELHKAGATVIVVTHEENIAAFTDRIIHFSDGQIIKDEINENPTKGSGKVHMKGLYRHFQKTAGTESGVVGC